MGRPSGTKNIMRTSQEKEKLVLEFKAGRLGYRKFAAANGIVESLLKSWIKKYDQYGMEGLKSKTGKDNKGNRIAALHKSKSLTDFERKDLEILKLKIENERLKKGYLVKGAGSKKEFITIKEMNSKSSKN